MTDKADNPVDTSSDESEQIQGRSIFIVETTSSGVAVKTAFMAEDGRVPLLPTIFPTQKYALSQIEELRNVVIKHFAQAAQVGAQVIAQANQAALNALDDNLAGPSPEDTIQ